MKRKCAARSRHFLDGEGGKGRLFQEKRRKLKFGKKNLTPGGVSLLFLRRSRAILQFGFLHLFGYVRCGILLLRKFCFSGYGTGDRLVCNRRLLGRVVGPIYSG